MMVLKEKMMKIYIVGTSGSGKSSLARGLSRKLSIPHTELDNLSFIPGWIERPRDQFKADVLAIVQSPSWILCGNYSLVQQEIFEAADQIIWLNYPFPKVFWRVTRRTFRRLILREPCCNGNYESFWRQFFTKYSIFWWVIHTYSRRKREYMQFSQNPTLGKKWITIHTEAELQDFLCLINR